MNSQKILVFCVGISCLSGCQTTGQRPGHGYEDNSYFVESDETIRPYNIVYGRGSSFMYENAVETGMDNVVDHEVVVPDSYHVGNDHAPVSHHDRDKTWVNSQSPESYTIEVGDSEKPSDVAKQLFIAPKKEHTAEVEYFQNGTVHYKGLYGSYPNYEAAKKALDALPNDLKQKSSIKSWQDVHEKLHS
mgnify:CR=1 FL=1